jgi:3-oxoacyl-[acyl-carrier-protein] synthase III
MSVPGCVRYERVRLAGIGFELAPIVVTSEELERRLAPTYEALSLAPGQLVGWTGIEERRWWPEEHRLSEVAALAAQRVLGRCGVETDEIGALLYAGVCREGYEPATATAVAARLHLGGGVVLHDVSNACLGVVDGILDLANRIELGQIESGLVVSAESARTIVEETIHSLNAAPSMERFVPALATLTGGSGAVAVLLRRDDGSERMRARPRLRGGITRTAPEHHELCRWGVHPDPDGRPGYRVERMTTDSILVMQNGIALGTATWQAFLQGMGWSRGEIDRTIGHQVGSAHREGILEAIGRRPEQDFVTYPHLGNIGTVSLPLTAALAEERGRVRAGQNVAWLGIGSGLVCSMLGWEW